jgi:hypothetical protein
VAFISLALCLAAEPNDSQANDQHEAHGPILPAKRNLPDTWRLLCEVFHNQATLALSWLEPNQRSPTIAVAQSELKVRPQKTLA